MKKISLKKYLENLYIFSILTIILALFALNRMCGGLEKDIVCFGATHYVLRNIMEHFLTGLYLPFFGLFCFYTGKVVYSKLTFKDFRFCSMRDEFLIIIFSGLLFLILEGYFQFKLKYNSASFYHFLLGFLGVVISSLFYSFYKK